MGRIQALFAISLIILILSAAIGHTKFTQAAAAPHSGLTALTATDMSADDDDVYRVVDEMPEIVGGIEELYKHLNYPERAMRAEIQGRVVIQFIIDAQGNVHNPEILRDIGGGCGQAAINAIQRVEFSPGRHEGQTVAVLYALPVTFRLE